MRILTDEEIDKIYDRWLHKNKEPKFLNWTTYLTTENARIVRAETLKEVGKWIENKRATSSDWANCYRITDDEIAKLSQGVVPC